MKRQLYDDQLIVITGAAGFIGSGVVSHLNDRGYYNLLLVDDLRKGDKWKNLRNKRFIDWISRYDLFDFLEEREREIEAIIHLGACSSTQETDGDYFFKTNYRFSVRLADYALTHGHRFIYASSAATYGKGEAGFSDDHDRLDMLCPINLYAFSKHLFDKWIKEQGVLDRVVGLKYFNIFGPNERHKKEMASMVMHLTDQIRKTGCVKLFRSSEPDRFADGEQCRDFYYVKNAVKTTCFFLDHDLNGIFNVGSGKAISWNQVARIIFKILEKEEKIDYIPMPHDLVASYQNYTCADMTKWNRELETKQLTFTNDFSLEEGIHDYVSHYLLKECRW